MKDSEIEQFCPANKQEWREWLAQHHQAKEAVWLIIYKKSSARVNLSWSEAVDEALCYGWIDSTKKAIDTEKYRQYFGKRKPNSTWSKVNKQKIEQLSKAGKMREAGLKCVEVAKQNKSWTVLDSVENLEVPKDLILELDKRPGAKDYILKLSKSQLKGLLYWIVSAKRPETRQKRIIEIAENAANQTKPNNFR